MYCTVLALREMENHRETAPLLSRAHEGFHTPRSACLSVLFLNLTPFPWPGTAVEDTEQSAEYCLGLEGKHVAQRDMSGARSSFVIYLSSMC